MGSVWFGYVTSLLKELHSLPVNFQVLESLYKPGYIWDSWLLVAPACFMRSIIKTCFNSHFLRNVIKHHHQIIHFDHSLLLLFLRLAIIKNLEVQLFFNSSFL